MTCIASEHVSDLQIKLHNRPQVLMLEANEHFRRRSFKEIQIPGQYLKNPVC